jgi:hypothetical protein
LALFAAVNHSGFRSPVAVRIGPTSRAIRSGAASTIAFMQGSFSHAANACPSRRTFGPKAHIHPNPRGRRSSGGTRSRSAAAFAPVAGSDVRPRPSSGVPASMRRISAESARNLADIHPFTSARSTGGIDPDAAGETSAGNGRTRSAAGRATRRTIAFTRSSRVTRNGAENIFWSFSERQAHLARRRERHSTQRCESQQK